ncbi:MAG: hypothetical protein ABWZ40_05360 [Caulobacterales bacterium]
MLKSLVAFPFIALAMVFVGDQPADDWVWSAPGWYGKADATSLSWIVNGPFLDEKSCAAHLPRGDTSAAYFCAFLDEAPVTP